MYYPLTHKQAETLHPVAYGELRKKKNASKAKSAKNDLTNFKLGYEVAVMIQGGRLSDLISGRIQPREKTIEEKLADYRKNAHVSLKANFKSLCLYVSLDEVPQSLIEEQRDLYEKEEIERKRFDALSPEDKDKELQRCLSQLAGPGFVAVNPDAHMQRLCNKAGVRVIGGK
jgi:hypothetical protein